MKSVPTLLCRELNSYFASVVGYIAAVFFLAVMGLIFWSGVRSLMEVGTQLTAMQAFFFWFWLPSLFVVPAMTMRVLAEEKRSGSLEMLMTAPVTDWEVVLAKWLGAVALYALMWGLTALYVVILRHFAGASAALDYGPIAAGYLGVLVIGQFLVALGVLGSALTKNQVTAFLITFALVFLFIIGTLLGAYLLRGVEWRFFGAIVNPGKWLESLSVLDHMREFARGMVDSRPLVLYLSGTVVVLFLTTRVVESRKWR